MREDVPPLPNAPSWCGALLKHRENFTYSPFIITFPDPWTIYSLCNWYIVVE